jgi:hypothetical protein
MEQRAAVFDPALDNPAHDLLQLVRVGINP